MASSRVRMGRLRLARPMPAHLSTLYRTRARGERITMSVFMNVGRLS